MFVPRVRLVVEPLQLMVEPRNLCARAVGHRCRAAIQTLWWAPARMTYPVCASIVGSRQKERLKGSDREGVDTPYASYTCYGLFQVAFSILETQEYTRSSSPVKLYPKAGGSKLNSWPQIRERKTPVITTSWVHAFAWQHPSRLKAGPKIYHRLEAIPRWLKGDHTTYGSQLSSKHTLYSESCWVCQA